MITITILLVITYLLNLVDYYQTIYFIEKFGLSAEVNPIGRFLLENNLADEFKFFIVPLILLGIGIIVKIDNYQKWAVYVIFCVFTFVVIWNFIMIFMNN